MPLILPRRYQLAVNKRVTSRHEVEAKRSSQEPRGKTILFVDDEPSILTIRRLIFEALGYLVVTAASGEVALDLLNTRVVDAVVLDYLMSPMNGEDLARRIRRKHRKTPIVLSSGCLSLPQSLLDAVDVWVEKGGPPSTLVGALEQIVAFRITRSR